MSAPATAREALIAEAIGDVVRLLDRVELLLPALDAARQALQTADEDLGRRIGAFDGQLTAITQSAKARAVAHIAGRTNELTRQTLEVQRRAMTDAARAIFETEIGSMLQRLSASLHRLVDRVDRPWDRWATHAATGVVSALVTWALALYFLLD